ncbi:MAG: phosphopyruvate hydratase [Alphaproteobacteria bacterium]|jgi:enolase
MKINNVIGREIIDSRGNPTIEVDVYLDSGVFGRAAAPSGASTGKKEALEKRDGDQKRFNGKGVLKAVKAVNTEIKKALLGQEVTQQAQLDKFLIELDGTENKSRLGANAIVVTSLAIAKAAANATKQPLFSYLQPSANLLPMPLINILNGGAHANNALDIQEFMIMPIAASSIKEAIQIGTEVFHSLKALLDKDGFSTSVGDEGGFAPNLKSSASAIEYVIKAIEHSGFIPGKDVALALDAAASEFYKNGKYFLEGEELELSSKQLVDYYSNLANTYPIFSIEDAMSEDDIDGWQLLTKELGNKIQLVGDDVFVSNPNILRAYIAKNIANAVLIKPNQIGTLTETLETIDIAHKSSYRTILSHRSGETEDTTIAHISVATQCGQIKTGSMSRTDRTAKYNELIRIEEFLGDKARFAKFNN